MDRLSARMDETIRLLEDIAQKLGEISRENREIGRFGEEFAKIYK